MNDTLDLRFVSSLEKKNYLYQIYKISYKYLNGEIVIKLDKTHKYNSCFQFEAVTTNYFQ